MAKYNLNIFVNLPETMLAPGSILPKLSATVIEVAPDGTREDIAQIAEVGPGFSAVAIEAPAGRRINLVVGLRLPGQKQAIASSPVQYGVSGDVDIVIDYPDPLAGRPEYERVTGMLAPWLAGRALAALPADERAALPRMSGVDEAAVARLAAAQAHATELAPPPPQAAPAAPVSQPATVPQPVKSAPAVDAAGKPVDTATPPRADPSAKAAPGAPDAAGRPVRDTAPDLLPILYALVARFGDSPLAALLLHSRTAYGAMLDQAVADNIAAAPAAALRQKAVDALIAARDRLNFNLDDDAGNGAAKAIFWAPIAPALRSKLLDAVLDAANPAAALDTPKLLAAPQKALLDEVFALFDAVNRHAPMLAALSRAKGGDTLFKRDGSGLDSDRLHLMTVADWQALAKTSGTPEAYAGKPDAELEYARSIVATIAGRAPGRNVAARLRASTVPGAADVSRVLTDHPTLDLRRQSVRGYFAGQAAELRPNEATLGQIELVQRTMRLAPDGDLGVAQLLIEKGYTSGYALLTEGKAKVIEKLGPTLGTAQVQAIYGTAQAHFTDSYAIGLIGVNQWNPLNWDELAVQEALPANLTSLFGNSDFCSCAQCQSVYGPAAYLADLLHWMRSDVSQSAYDQLEARRPDIPYILLNCANADTSMPYIDIVNEVLSFALLPTNARPNLGTFQTHGTSDERLLDPEYRAPFAPVDATLRTTYARWTLPYDTRFDAGRAYLEALGCDHARLVAALSPPDWGTATPLERRTWAAARFGLVPEEFALITTNSQAATNFWATYWGLGSAPGSLVKPLLGTGEFADLGALEAALKTDFVSGRERGFPFDHVAFADGAPCDIDQAHLAKADGQAVDLDVGAADRLMRFERLRRRTGVGADQLARALALYGGAGIDAGFVTGLAAALETTTRIKASLDDLLDWASPPAADHSDAFAAALGITRPAFDAALRLIAPGTSPWANANDALQFAISLSALQQVAIAPQELVAMLAGEDAWSLAVSATVASATFQQDAKTAWQAVETALEPIGAMPAPNAAIQPDALTAAAIKAQRATAIDLALGSVLGLPASSTTALIDAFVSTLNTMVLQNSNTTVPLTGAGWRGLFDQARTDMVAGNPVVNRDWGGPSGDDAQLWFPEVYRYLLRIARIAKALGLDADGTRLLVDYAVLGPALGLQSGAFPVPLDLFMNRFGAGFVSAAPLMWLARAVGQAKALDVTQVDFFELANALERFPLLMTFSVWATHKMGPASVLAGVSAPELQALADQTRQLQTNWDLGAWIARMFALSDLRDALGLDIADIIALVWTQPPAAAVPASNRFTDTQIVSLHAALAAAASGAAAWRTRYQPIQDRLRRNLRDALLAYYLGHGGYAGISEIYAHFLIDPEMEPCMKTSRIVQATSACQTLIQRGLLGLEPDVVLDEADKKEWVWRSAFQVWVANRKVFLYPENYTDPTLRLTRTPFFAEAQDRLLQDELTTPNVEKVFNEYLTRLEGVSRLDIRGLYYDDDEGVSYVFARSWNHPFGYYYRRREANRRWGAWQEIPIDIQGDHLIPMMFNRRLYLFWVTFTPKEHREYKIASDAGAPYLELRLCYSKLEFGKWTPKKQYDEFWIAGQYSGAELFDPSKIKDRLIGDPANASSAVVSTSLDPSNFFFWAEPVDGDLVIRARRWFRDRTDAYHMYSHEVNFVISGCDERLEFQQPTQVLLPNDPRLFHLAGPAWSVPDGMQLVQGEVRHDPNSWPTVEVRRDPTYATGSTGSSTILNRADFPYHYTYAHQDRIRVPAHPFFVADRRHTHLISQLWIFIWDIYGVELHEHPYCCLMLRELHRLGIEGLLAPQDGTDPNPLRRQQLQDTTYFANEYDPASNVLQVPNLSFDFDYTGAYSAYNWEIFFHLPVLIGHQLRLDGKHAEAIRWLSFVFDPTNRDAIPDASRYWMCRPFFEHVTEGSIAALMALLQSSAPQDQARRQAFAAQIDEWRKHPFEPHAVAAMRIQAYMRWTVMEYIQTLIDWGDKLFRQFTTESVNQAIQLYRLAQGILGPRPRQVAGATPPDRCFRDLVASLDAFSNAAVALENTLAGTGGSGTGSGAVVSPVALYFCIPENPQLLAYWDLVESRLSNIHRCRDIDGNARDLALFAPEIDPAMLVRAVASGMDLSEVLDNFAAPDPRHRFAYLHQRALDFCNDVKSLGGQLLSALEKSDAGALDDLLKVNERNLLNATRGYKKLALDEAQQSLAAAEYGKTLAEKRLDYFSSRQFMIPEESAAKSLTEAAHNLQLTEQSLMVLSAAFALLDLQIGSSGNGLHFTTKLDLTKAPSFGAQAAGAMASTMLNKASRALTAGSYVRRQDDWTNSAQQAQLEIQQADKQIAAAQLRVDMAQKDLDNQDIQIEQSQAIHDWMRRKFTGEQLYGWLFGQLKTLHRKAYTLAFDLALQAQRAFQLELGRSESFVAFGDWDSTRQGLLAGEMLGGQLRELEAAYLRFNTREFELTRSISLRLLDPAALVDLRQNGRARFDVPEWLVRTAFDDGMQLYAMRMRSMAVSVPCVTGPNTPVNVKLRLLSSAIGWAPEDDLTSPALWLSPSGPSEIVTSSAVNDPALFEASLRDERYLPFENAGVVSQWEVSLPVTPEFDPQTISDLILHIRFVAKGNIGNASPPAPVPTPRTAQARPDLLMSWRQDLTDDWATLVSTLRTAGTTSANCPFPAPGPAVVPYRLRALAPASLTPTAAWVLYRNADGSRGLDTLTSIASLAVTIMAAPLPDDRILVYTPPNTTPSAPLFTFAAPAGLAANRHAVEDILVAFAT